MKSNRILGAAMAAALTFAMSTAAFAQSNSKAANLQAMRWYAQQQMSMGRPNPYPGVDLNTGAGFSEFRKSGIPYFSNYPTNYVNQYGYNNNYPYGYTNQYPYTQNPWYGYTGTPWF